MSEGKRQLDEMRAVLREMAAEEAPGLLMEALSAARSRALQTFEEVAYEEILQAVGTLRAETEAEPMPGRRRPEPEPELAQPASPAAAREEQPASPAAARQELLWVYCVLAGHDAAPAAQALQGIVPGTPVEAVEVGQLAALVSRVPAAEYDDAHLREHLEDLEWVERTARGHEAVLDLVLRRATVVPLRLCTIYRDLDGVRRLLADNREIFSGALDAVVGCEEWGVKVFAEPGAGEGLGEGEGVSEGEGEGVSEGASLGEHAPAAAPADLESQSSGAAYLAGRKREREAARRAYEFRDRCAHEAHRRVAALARASATNPPQRPELHGRPGTMLLNGAYLVAREHVAELHDVVAGLAAQWGPLGFAVEVTGPWPPYNFVSGPAGVMP